MEMLADLARTGGAAWVLVFVAFTAVVYLFRQLSKEREMCANDWRTTVAGNTLQMKEMQKALEAMTAAIDRMSMAVARFELMPAAIDRMTLAIDQLREVIRSRTDEAIQSNRAMREALLKKGVDL